MKKLITLISLFVTIFANGTDYYFSSSTGNDANAGTSSGAPFQTIGKLNALVLHGGDHVFFKRGDTFYGTYSNISNGSSGNPIIFDVYGSGALPVLTALSDATGWLSIGTNIWESSALTFGQTGTSTLMVTVSGVSVPMGKWPNGKTSSGWRTYSSVGGGNTAISDNAGLPGSPNWTNGTIVIRKNQYTIQKGTITSQVGNTLNYIAFPSQTVNPASGYGYFVQNHLSTLDVQNEWYYNPNTKKLDIYSTTTPSNVKVGTATYIMNLTNRSFLTFNNLSFQGANYHLITANNATNLTFSSCELLFAGNTAFWANTTNNLSIQNCTIGDNNNVGIYIGTVTSSGNVINNNNIYNTGLNPGMAMQDTATVIESCNGVLAFGSLTFQNNTIRSSGYSAIQFKGTNVLIQHNFIDSTCITKDEGAAIYSFVGKDDNTNFTGEVIDGNIVLHAVGALAGKSQLFRDAKACYMDINCRNVTITNNTFAFCGSAGLTMQDNQNDIVRGNTIYDCYRSLAIWTDAAGAVPTRNLRFAQNICVLKTPNANLGNLTIETNETSVPGFAFSYLAFGTSDSNVIATAINDNNAWFTNIQSTSFTHQTVAQWKANTGYDIHSQASPVVVDSSDLRFEYNPSNSPIGVPLGANLYVDAHGVSKSGTLTVPAWSSVVLFKTGVGNSLPTANAGPDINITLPTNSVTMAGTASDADGTVTDITWSKITGPGGVITNIHSLTTTITGLVQGTYLIQLQVTDNSSGVSTDNMVVTVSAAANINPTANAGSDASITLPTNSFSRTGIGTDADGTIQGYQWTKILGPSQFTITNPSQATTSFTNLVQGAYKFNLHVVDNSGGFADDDFQITVNPAANIPPTATAQNQNITLPTSSAPLIGVGADQDGTVASVHWVWLTGPGPTPVIANASISSTSASNMTTPGAYQFRFDVTDNSSATTSAFATITVSPAPNVGPTADAGVDKNITLPVNSTSANGSGTDPDGTIQGYQWTKILGPSQFTITNPSQGITSFTNLVQGIYQFQLMVTDNQGAVDLDTMQVTVNAAIPPPNQFPNVNAGIDKNITLPTSSISVVGTASDPDGTIASTTWSALIGNPGSFTITNASLLSTSFTGFSIAGVYKVKLAATDNLGATSFDTMQIVVSAPINQLPVANAGSDQVDSFTTDNPNIFITLSGSGTDADGDIQGYQWVQIFGPNTSLINSPAQASTQVTNLTPGVYQYQLRVIDNSGAIDYDTVMVTITITDITPPEIPPIANAGPDKRATMCFFFCNTTSLGITASASQSGSAPITSYLWEKVSGPSGGDISDPTSVAPTLNNLNRGHYTYKLTITDANGNVSVDSFNLDVYKQRLNIVKGRIVIQDY